MEKLTDSYGASIFKDVNHDCVFNIVFDLVDEYSIYHLNYDTYLHHVFRNGSTGWYISHEPDTETVRYFILENDMELSRYNNPIVTVDRLNIGLNLEDGD